MGGWMDLKQMLNLNQVEVKVGGELDNKNIKI